MFLILYLWQKKLFFSVKNRLIPKIKREHKACSGCTSSP